MQIIQVLVMFIREAYYVIEMKTFGKIEYYSAKTRYLLLSCAICTDGLEKTSVPLVRSMRLKNSTSFFFFRSKEFISFAYFSAIFADIGF